MATKEISILIKAKNSLAQGLTSAGKQLQAFGQSAMRIGKFFVTGFMAAGAAVAGFAAKALQAYGVQEQAEKSLVAAMNAHGQAGEALIAPLKKIAAAIQDETGAADESTLAGMARMKMLGVQTEKLGEAAKATIALKAIGMEEAAAQKAVAMAMQGNYDLLNRYVPALRQATSEEEKAAIVKDLFTKGYEQQKAVLGTVSGQWAALKGRIGDMWEVVGEAISQNGTLTDILEKAGTKVKELGEKLSEWVSQGGVVNAVAGIKMFAENVSYYMQLAGNTASVLWASLSDGAETVFNYLFNVFRTWKDASVASFQFVGDYAIALWEKVKRPWTQFDPPDIGPYLEKLGEFGEALAGHDAQVTAQTEKALAEREALQENHNAKIEALAEEQAAALTEHQAKTYEQKKIAEEAQRQFEAKQAAASVEQNASTQQTLTEDHKEELDKRVENEKAALAETVSAHDKACQEIRDFLGIGDAESGRTMSGYRGLRGGATVTGNSGWLASLAGPNATASVGASSLATGTAGIGGVGIASSNYAAQWGTGALYTVPTQSTVDRGLNGEILNTLKDIRSDQKELLRFG